jgi:hypothetical protein
VSAQYADVIMSYVPDDKQRWAKNNHKILMEDVKDLNKLIPYTWLENIGQTIHDFIGKTYFNHDAFNDCMMEIEERAYKYCKKCRKNQKLYEFEGVFETCRSCRDKDRERRFMRSIKIAVAHIQLGNVVHRFKIAKGYYSILCISQAIEREDPAIEISSWAQSKSYYHIEIMRKAN